MIANLTASRSGCGPTVCRLSRNPLRLLLLSLSLLLAPCAFAAAKKAPAAKAAPAVEYNDYQVHAGLPQWMGGRGMLYVQGSDLDVKLNSSPFDYWVAKVAIFTVWVTILAFAGLVVGAVMKYYKIPLATDVMVISAGTGALSVATILLLDALSIMWPYLLAALVVGVVGYIAYLLLTKTKLLQNCKEFYHTGKILKTATTWDEPVKNKVLNVQSDSTIAMVNDFEAEEKAAVAKLAAAAAKAKVTP